MGLTDSMSVVFSFLRSCFEYLPNAVQLLVILSFGGMVFILILKGIGK